MKGRNRHLLVDTLGLIWGLVVHATSALDRAGAKLAWNAVLGKLPQIEIIRADGGSVGKLIEWGKQSFGWLLEIVKHSDNATGFQVLPQHWIVERTIGWFIWCRRLSKDDEELAKHLETMNRNCMIPRILRQLKPHDLEKDWRK